MKTIYTVLFILISYQIKSYAQDVFEITPVQASFGVGSTFGYDTYTNNMDYTWNVDIEEDKYVRLEIEHYFEGNGWDYLSVYTCDDNFENLKEIVTINTRVAEIVLIDSDVNNGKVVVKFTSDGSVNETNGYAGFEAFFEGVDENEYTPIRWDSYSHTFNTYDKDNALIINPYGNIGAGVDPGTNFFKFNRTENPNIILQNDINSLEFGVSSILGGFSNYANIGDAVIRTHSTTANSLHIHLRNTQNDGNSSITFGDMGDSAPLMSIFNNSKIAIGHTENDRDALLSIEGDVSASNLVVENSVGIGTTVTGGHALAVEGSIGAREIIVETTTWADYVFDKDYELRSLEEVEDFILENNHLPDIPSAKQVKEDGISVGEMNILLMQKIEELTLYMIELKKQNEKLETEVEALKQIK